MVKKYTNHPQKFESLDPELQKQWESLKEVLCDNEYMRYYKIMIGQKINLRTVFNVWTTPSTDLTNIWSHFIFGVFFLIRSFFFPDRFFWLNFMTGYTYLMSSLYHTFRNYSRRLFDIFLCFDVSGIIVQIITYDFVDTLSFFSGKRNDLVRCYLTVFVLLASVTVLLIPVILHYKFYTLRTVLLSVVATSGFIPIIHEYCLHEPTPKILKVIRNRVIAYILQAVGIFFRGSKIPERWSPPIVFQEFFHSHFWFHVVASIGSYYACMSSEAYF